MTLKEVLKKKIIELKSIPVDEPETSAEFLLRYILKMSRSEFYANLDKELSDEQIDKYSNLIERRKKHEPVYQITGEIEFWGLDFEINGDVLVPRPETEFLVKEVLKKAKGKKNLRILDVGTGAGPIIIALASELKRNRFFASDVSEEALIMAKRNAKKNNLDKDIVFKAGSLLVPWKGQKFDIITANLPYIPHEDLPGLTVEIYHYEPRVALDGGEGGLKIYRDFLKELPEYLNDDGLVFCEIGKDQGKLFTKLVQEYLSNSKCLVLKDLAGFDRIGVITKE